ncbi:MAG: prolipoprotein diacylglyceryl transferase [Candidatus Brocadiia bacterium]
MYPYLIDIPLPWGGELTVASYGVMIMLGFLLALYIGRGRAARMGVDPVALFDSAVVGLFGGVVGARLFYVIQFWEEAGFGANPLEIIRIDRGGLVFYGGLIGGGIGFFLMAFRRKLPIRATLTVAASVVPLAHTFGRIGCFLNGCCYGRITTFPPGLRFPRILRPGNAAREVYNVGDKHIAGSLPFLDQLTRTPPLVEPSDLWSQPVHPTQLYAVGYNFLIFLFLTLMLPRQWRMGEVAWLYCILYGTARYANEMVRATERVWLGMSAAQLVCVPLVVFGVVMFLRERAKPPEPMPEQAPDG